MLLNGPKILQNENKSLGAYSIYKREDEINAFLLLLLLKIIYNCNNRFDDVLFEYLHDLSLETNTVEPFSKFSLKSIEQIGLRPLKITLKEPRTNTITTFDN